MIREKAFVVGHDWGAVIGWCLSTFRPDRIKGFVSLCVPFNPRDPNTKPIKSFKKVFGDEFYICQFQVCTVLSLYLSFNMNVHTHIYICIIGILCRNREEQREHLRGMII